MVDPDQATNPIVNFPWPGIPYPAFITAGGVAVMSAFILVVSRHFDPSQGLLTLSVMLMMAFIAVTVAAMVYQIPQTPTTEILIGAMATSLGAIIAFWMSDRRK